MCCLYSVKNKTVLIMLHLKSVESFAADFNMERTVLLLSPCAGAVTGALLPLKPQH